MNELKIIKSYTESLFYHADKGNVERIYQQLSAVLEILEQNPKIKEAMCSPVILNSNKNKIIEALNKINLFEKIVIRFFAILIKKGRFVLLPEIAKSYFALLSESKGIKFAEITAAGQLAKEEINTIRKYLEKELSKVVEVQTIVNPALIGGVVIKYDSKLIDCSIRGAVKKIEKLAKNTAI